MTDPEGRVVRSSGLPPGWEVAEGGRSIQDLIHPDDFDAEVLAALATGRIDRLQLECRIRASDGEIRYVLCFGSRVRLETDYLLFAVEDVTRLRVRAEIAAGSDLLDAATQLPARALHDNRLRHALAADAETGRVTAVVRVRIGSPRHLAEPETVVLAARRLQQALPAAATVTRFGDAEFSVLLPALAKGETEVRAAIAGIRRCLEPEWQPMIGYALAVRGDLDNPAALVRRSVLAMYRPDPNPALAAAAEPVPTAPQPTRRDLLASTERLLGYSLWMAPESGRSEA